MLSRLLSCRRGVVSVEAAVIFPAMIALVMGVMDYGLLIFTFAIRQSVHGNGDSYAFTMPPAAATSPRFLFNPSMSLGQIYFNNSTFPRCFPVADDKTFT